MVFVRMSLEYFPNHRVDFCISCILIQFLVFIVFIPRLIYFLASLLPLYNLIYMALILVLFNSIQFNIYNLSSISLYTLTWYQSSHAPPHTEILTAVQHRFPSCAHARVISTLPHARLCHRHALAPHQYYAT